MRTIQTTLYTLAELKTLFPDAYQRAFERYQRDVTTWETPWQDETMASLKAVAKCLGFTLRDWSIGPYSRNSYVRASGDYETEDLSGGRSLAIARSKLRNAGFRLGKGPAASVKFNGDCPLTGYCADDDAAEHVWKALLSGDTLKEAVESLADWAQGVLEAECEYQQGKEAFETWAGDLEFDENGNEAG